MGNPLQQISYLTEYEFNIDSSVLTLMYDVNAMLNAHNPHVIGFFPFNEPGIDGYGIGIRGLFDNKDVSLITLWSDCLLHKETGAYELYFAGTDDTCYMLKFSSLQAIYNYVHVTIPGFLKYDGYITKTSNMIEIN